MHRILRHIGDFLHDHEGWLIGGGILIGFLLLALYFERRGITWERVAHWGPVRWYGDHPAARRFTVQLAGVLLIFWLAQTYSLWVTPTLRPSQLFTPPVVGPQGVDLAMARVVDHLEDRVSYTGTVRPYEETVVYARTDGYVKQLAVYPGDTVHKGQVLAVLETSNLDPVLKKAQAGFAYWQAERARSEALFKGGSISRSALDQVRQNFRIAKAQVSLLETRIGYATIRARTDGLIAKRWIYPGVYVKTGQPVLSIDNLDRVRIRFSVGERDLLYLHPGSRVYLRFPQMAPDLLRQSFSNRLAVERTSHRLRVTAKVAVVFPNEDPQTRTGTVEVRLENPHHILKSNTYTVGSLVRRETDHALVVPRSAVIRISEGKPSVVFTGPRFSDDGEVKRKKVVTGMSSQRYIQVIKGIKPEEFVVTRGNRIITDGQTVHVLHREGGS
ncbi:MAG: efflux RND transporter periplasmic adaptor subunit [Nitrospirota bacterium]|nr:efflux RND transporter periplasmic adaptor subunit [Nitrospirota bacterium]